MELYVAKIKDKIIGSNDEATKHKRLSAMRFIRFYHSWLRSLKVPQEECDRSDLKISLMPHEYKS